MNYKALKLVTFDATNTLLKFRISPIKYYAIVGREYGYQGTEADLERKFSNGFKHMWEMHPNFGKSTIKWKLWWQEVVKVTFAEQMPSNDSVEKVAKRLIEEFKTSKCWKPADGTEDVLMKLQNLGIYIGVISNSDPRLHNVLENLSLNKYFDFVITSYDAGFCKPDKRIFELAISKLPSLIKQKECLHIGDHISNDYEGARAAGWYSILVTDNCKKHVNSPTKHMIKNLRELVSLIKI